MAKQHKPARKAAPSRTGRGQAGKTTKSRSKGAKAPPKVSVKKKVTKKAAGPKSQSTKKGAGPARSKAVPAKKGKSLRVVPPTKQRSGQAKPVKVARKKTPPRAVAKPARPAPKVAAKKPVKKGETSVKKTSAPTTKPVVLKKAAVKGIAAAQTPPATTGAKVLLDRTPIVAKPPAPAVTKATENAEKPPASASKKKAPSPPSGQPIQAVMMGLEQSAAPAKAMKRALKERFVVEFPVRSTPHVLYELISTPSGFSEWFCDDVDARGDEHVFFWGAEQQKALCIGRKAGELIRFRWMEDEDPGAFFELRIRVDDMTNDVALVVTDHAWPKDVEGARQLWTSQVAQLVRVIGA
jgi:uncharacterized protein YndB with AHSA1/START domain